MDDGTREVAKSLRTFLDEVLTDHRPGDGGGPPSLWHAVNEHLGVDPRELSVVTEPISALRFADADIALSILCKQSPGSRLVGIGGGNARQHHDLAEMLQTGDNSRSFPEGPPDYTSVSIGPDTQRRVISLGVRLFAHAGEPIVVLQRAANPQYGRGSASLEVLCRSPEGVEGLLTRVRSLMLEHSVLRGQVISLTRSEYEPGVGGVTFHRRPVVPQTQIVLPDGVLERLRRHVIGIGSHRDELRAAGQHLKRGVLLHGPPGTGKTHTIRHLIGITGGTTVVLLSGQSLAYVSVAAETARSLSPAIVVLEDCDLVAEDRGLHFGPQPLLFEVLDTLDGLNDDCDVAFLLTTNRPGVLEPALAQRPGRIDLAVELPLPDGGARRRLFELYAQGLPLSPTGLAAAADRCEGTTASFAKELIRRAVLTAAEREVAVDDSFLEEAVDEMLTDQEALTRALLGDHQSHPADPGSGESGWFAYGPGLHP